MRNSLLVLILSLLLPVSPLLAAQGQGQGPTTAELVKLLQKRYDAIQDISAHFTQETYPAGATHGVEAEGDVYFKRPQKMRWEYATPDPQLIVTEGDEVYVYEQDVKQVMIIPRSQFLSSQISRAFFFGKGNLDASFIVEAADAGTGKTAPWTIKLTPRGTTEQVRHLWITLDPKTHLVARMYLEDLSGGHTSIRFTDVRVNTGLSDGLFHFVPPPDAEIYRAGETQ